MSALAPSLLSWSFHCLVVVPCMAAIFSYFLAGGKVSTLKILVALALALVRVRRACQCVLL